MGADPERRFEELYASSYRPLLGYALRRCPDPDDAADVVAETFMVAWRRIEEVPQEDEARLWLFGVARKVLANQRRGERRHEQRTAALRAQLAASPLVAELPGEDFSQLGQVFRSLPEDDRELLALVAWERLSPSEIAKVLGTSANVVRVRLYRARSRFARRLAEAGVRHSRAVAFEGSRL
ncbi:RNA polymerase, sigma-24 subunit, ECF subfamily [[Actinomadura] parvosata subsp. kistnae]|uniref:RNA polymerase subunit sigma-24 n=1 Tax=[Actinomadura] parvosata subsp. kistnae TaxID=1909395 RepID=A0A1V0AGF6_9ACTN|nr:sigma-70 family RNA polymerase sigma factor [Nonomuraea sp. ATCC 55076]AQZ69321.1 RNA polymerase subunit sigma-24 [Nonomuraea sp. ATCC 55076]SPL92045.1 RNA polymerase, sigma-24 subunit, ECF subfamily [Actinomadura parvosata subsp. kistnae]